VGGITWAWMVLGLIVCDRLFVCVSRVFPSTAETNFDLLVILWAVLPVLLTAELVVHATRLLASLGTKASMLGDAEEKD